MITYTDEETGKKNKERIVVKRVEIGPDLNIDDVAANFELKPYDHIFIRVSRDFEPQRMVKLYGEVEYPGEYSLLSKEESLLEVIERAGGLTTYSFNKGAKLYRAVDSTGFVLLDIDKAIKRPNKSRFNYILAEGDSIYIPPVKNVVTLKGAIRRFEADSTLMQISVPYVKRKRAGYYIDNYGAGYSRFAKRSRTYVTQPNGNIQKTKSFLFFQFHPKVENGAIVSVDITDRKRKEKVREARKKDRNWNDAFDSITAKLATILTVLLLAQQAANR